MSKRISDLSPREQSASRCKHFNGVFNKKCRVGIVYADVNVALPGRGLELPCIRDPLRSAACIESPGPLPACALREWKSQEELDKEDREINAFLTGFAEELQKGIENCVHCGAKVDHLEQVGRCVYARPCGCRQYQGRLPKK